MKLNEWTNVTYTECSNSFVFGLIHTQRVKNEQEKERYLFQINENARSVYDSHTTFNNTFSYNNVYLIQQLSIEKLH